VRRLIVYAALLATIGCRREEKIKLEATEESQPVVMTTVTAADPKVAMQFIKGFHGVEQNAWRWTMGKFALTLQTPEGAGTKGATLVLKFSAPEVVMQKLKKTALSASIQNTVVGSSTYTSAGEHTFRADVAPTLLKSEAITVEFALDPVLPAGTLDGRELGVIFVSAALEPK
jgi:hypothetical protein